MNENIFVYLFEYAETQSNIQVAIQFIENL